jgi:hypothetical protein
MYQLKVVIDLLAVRVNRIILLLVSVKKALALGLPLAYSQFPLITRLNLTQPTVAPQADDCDHDLVDSIDVIVSLYRFSKYESVLRESVRSCFGNPKITFHFVIVSGTESERAFIRELTQGSHHKIHYSDERIGIYSAWNLAIEGGSGDLITNLNADDLRLPHSICQHGAFLESSRKDGSFADFILSSEVPSIEQLKSAILPISTLGKFDEKKLVFGSQNYMHCAPMWRRDLHLRLGQFDESLKSSGDTEFWLRSMSLGAEYVYFPQVTTIYFHNPEGLSTALSSTGMSEWKKVRDKYLRNRAMFTP